MINIDMKKHILQMYTQMHIHEVLPTEEYQIFVKPNYTSATWCFEDGVNKIIIGENIFNNCSKELAPKYQLLYMRAFLYHEFAHSIWTKRDIKDTRKQLNEKDLCFNLYNLFEDARIEEKMRLHISKYFKWTDFEDLEIPSNAIELFFYILQNEHKTNIIKSLKAHPSFQLSTILPKVLTYYKKVLQCKSFKDMQTVMQKWYKDFPQTDEYLNMKEIEAKLYAMEGSVHSIEGNFASLIEGLENILSPLDKRDNSSVELETVSTMKTTQGKYVSLLSERVHNFNVDAQVQEKLFQKMSTLFHANTRYNTSKIPSKRFNIKGLMQNSPKIYKRKELTKRIKPRITLIIDMSGSMYDIVEHMQLILRVMNQLSADNIIECTLLLSAMIGNKSQHEKIKLPTDKKILNKIIPDFLGEGISLTMKNNINLLQNSNYVWVLTDGCITSDEVDKNFFNSLGIKTHAFYIGSSSFHKPMQTFFDYVVCAEDATGLVNDIFILIK